MKKRERIHLKLRCIEGPANSLAWGKSRLRLIESFEKVIINVESKSILTC